MALTTEDENFVRLAKVILDIVPENLRTLFEKEWNKKYSNNQWDGTKTSGSFLLREMNKNNPSGMKGTFDKQALASGDKNQWDCTTLFFVLLYSKLEVIPKMRVFNQRSPPLRISEEVDKLREIRNRSFGHLPSASICEANYNQAISEIEQIFGNLGWMQGLQDINLIKSSAVSTSEMETLKKKLEAEQKKNDELLEMAKEVPRLKQITYFNSSVLMILVIVGIAVVMGMYFENSKSRDIIVEMSNGLKRYYTTALEKWTMPILKFSKHTNTFGSVKKLRKAAMIEPLLRKVTEDQHEKSGPRFYESEFLKMSLIKIGDIIQKNTTVSIVEGTGGIGKTSLVDYVTYQWAQSEIFNQDGDLKYSFLFRFQCRSLNRYRGRTLTVDDLFMEKFKVNISNMEGVKGENILIILDGFDEFFAYQGIFNIDNQEDSITSIVRNVLAKETVLFPGHYTLVTGRHHAVDVLRNRERDIGKAMWIEMLGFSELAVEKYVEVFSEGNSSLAEYLKSRIASSVTLQSLATTPVFLRTLCSILYHEGGEFTTVSQVTMTDIYSWIVGSFLKFHFASMDREFIEIPMRKLLSREDVRKFLKDISKDSYKLLAANEIEFDCNKLSSVNLSDPVIQNLVNGFVLKSEDELESRCEFWHVTIQEYFAAFHCVTTNCQALVFKKNNWHKTVQFMAGFISTQRRKKKGIKHFLLGNSPHLENDRVYELLHHEPFWKRSCSQVCRRHFLQIFFESFAVGDEVSDSLGPQKWGEYPVLDDWKRVHWFVFSLPDAVLFSHFGKLMMANGLETKLVGFMLFVINVKVNNNVFVELLEVFPICYGVGLVNIRLEDTLDSDQAVRLLSPFVKGIHHLQWLGLVGCLLSNATGNLVLNVIPYIEVVVIFFQNITISNANEIANGQQRSLAKQSSTSVQKLKNIMFISCTFENKSEVELAKFLPFLNTVSLAGREIIPGFKLITERIYNVLVNDSVSGDNKMKHLHLSWFQPSLLNDTEKLPRIVPYLEGVYLNCGTMTKRFVSELVKSFHSFIKEARTIRLSTLAIQDVRFIPETFNKMDSLEKIEETFRDRSNFSNLESKHFGNFRDVMKMTDVAQNEKESYIMAGLAKIVPLIRIVDFGDVSDLTLNDLKALSTSVSRYATSKQKNRYFKLEYFKINLLYGIDSNSSRLLDLMLQQSNSLHMTVNLAESLLKVDLLLKELVENVGLFKMKCLSERFLISKKADVMLPAIKSHFKRIIKIFKHRTLLMQKLKLIWRKVTETEFISVRFMNRKSLNVIREGKLKRDLQIAEEMGINVLSRIEKIKKDIIKEKKYCIWCLKEIERINLGDCRSLPIRVEETRAERERYQTTELLLSLEIKAQLGSSKVKKEKVNKLMIIRKSVDDKLAQLPGKLNELLDDQNRQKIAFMGIKKIFKELFSSILPLAAAAQGELLETKTRSNPRYWILLRLQELAKLVSFINTVQIEWLSDECGLHPNCCNILLKKIRNIAMDKKYKHIFALQWLIVGEDMLQKCDKSILDKFGVTLE